MSRGPGSTIGDDRIEVLSQNLGRFHQGDFRDDGSIRPDLEDQPVIVRALSDSSFLDLVSGLA